MGFERILEKERKPTEKEIFRHLGKSAKGRWIELVSFLEENYSFSPELVFGGAKYGWAIRYRKSGKTLCTLLPEAGSFTTLVVLGKKEVEGVEENKAQFGEHVFKVFKEARQFHDGRWLWIRILKKSDISDVERLLSIKKRPTRTEKKPSNASRNRV
jgi:hypothetical protein